MKIEGGPFDVDGFRATDAPRIDCVPPVMFTEKVGVRYRLELTEAQLGYVYDLMSVDEGEHADELSSREYDELVAQVCYHHSSIHGPGDTDDRPPQADNE